VVKSHTFMTFDMREEYCASETRRSWLTGATRTEQVRRRKYRSPDELHDAVAHYLSTLLSVGCAAWPVVTVPFARDVGQVIVYSAEKPS
jgi:hypothetical protein